MSSSLPLFGMLAELNPWFTVLAAILAAAALGYRGTGGRGWLGTGALFLWGLGGPLWSWGLWAAVVLLFVVPPVRRHLVSRGVMSLMSALDVLPRISETEQTAIEAGTVWLEGELFSGDPDLSDLHEAAYPDLSDKERAFLEGPVEKVCEMTDDWEVHVEKDLPDAVWSFLKEKKFFGMVIPEEYGGLGFSPSANSAVVSKLASRSSPLAITVMVPNSLGPAELLIHYGTDEQQEYYLPRLASGEEMPAFALTESEAGSDAGAMQSTGTIFEGEDGELYLRLNWKKRYITLSPIATVLGLAFKLRDPDGHLGGSEELGITCALIPTDTEGVQIDTRHDPLGVPFYNAPTRGEDVVVPLDAIIGGAEGAGRGWRMLMELLSAGRGISLPASAIGAAKKTTRTTGAYARIRKQFGLSIGRFEGVEEPLTRIGGFTYLMEAARKYTNGGLDEGAKPAVVSAIMKYNCTELGREVINDGMDVLGGAGICRGPRNLLAHDYEGIPISITVEGANILTRTMMIFGQGAIRAHPYLYDEITALLEDDLDAFDRAFWGHVGHVVTNGIRSDLLWWTRGRIAGSPTSGPAAPYYRRLVWASSSFALFADLALLSLGGGLKRKEKLSGRFADVLSWMYLVSAVLRRFEAEDRDPAHRPLMEWAVQYGFARMQEAFEGILQNMPIPGFRWFFRGPVSWAWRLNPLGSEPDDALGHRVAQAIQEPGDLRDALTGGMFVPSGEPASESEEAAERDALAHLDRTLRLVVESKPVVDAIKDAMRDGTISRARPEHRIDEALEAGVISREEADQLRRAERARREAVRVDEFTQEEYVRETPGPPVSATRLEDTR